MRVWGHPTIMAQDFTPEIVHEIALAIRKLGGNPATVKLKDTYRLNRVLEFLAADIYLLSTVGSWRDMQSDEQTLSELRDWNAHGKDALIGISRYLRNGSSPNGDIAENWPPACRQNMCPAMPNVLLHASARQCSNI